MLSQSLFYPTLVGPVHVVNCTVTGPFLLNSRLETSRAAELETSTDWHFRTRTIQYVPIFVAQKRYTYYVARLILQAS